MANGKPYDHPLTDILIHGRLVYSEEIDAMIRDIVQLGGRDLIADMLLRDYNDMDSPDLAKLRTLLLGIRADLKRNA